MHREGAHGRRQIRVLQFRRQGAHERQRTLDGQELESGDARKPRADTDRDDDHDDCNVSRAAQ